MNEKPRILVAGIGNIFFGDDRFGIEVVRQLSGRRLPNAVKVVRLRHPQFRLSLHVDRFLTTRKERARFEVLRPSASKSV